MEDALAIAKNTSNAMSMRVDALTGLRYLVEPIDNAMGEALSSQYLVPGTFLVSSTVGHNPETVLSHGYALLSFMQFGEGYCSAIRLLFSVFNVFPKSSRNIYIGISCKPDCRTLE